MQKPLSESPPTPVHRIPISCLLAVVPAACPVWLFQPRIASAYTQTQAQCRSQVDGNLAPASPLRPRPLRNRCSHGHGHGSIPSLATTGTSCTNKNVHGMGMGSGGAPLMESPHHSGSGPHLPNGPGRAGARRPTYAHGSSVRVNPSLLPPGLWMGPLNRQFLQTWVS
jgi:hypothetical protein